MSQLPPRSLQARVAEEQAYLQAAGRQALVLNVSGGVDSTATALICKGAGPTVALLLPCGTGPEAEADLADGQRVCTHLGLPHVTLDLTGLWQSFVSQLTEQVQAAASQAGLPVNEAQINWAANNLKPTLRMAAAGFFADALGGLTIGTDNAIEHFLGYFSIRGDGVADRQPIRDCTKAEVRGLASQGGFDQDLIDRVPSAGLWPGQTDEAELGFTYDVADRFFLWLLAKHQEEAVFDSTLTVTAEAAERLLADPTLPVERPLAQKILQQNQRTAFKRRLGETEKLLSQRGLA